MTRQVTFYSLTYICAAGHFHDWYFNSIKAANGSYVTCLNYPADYHDVRLYRVTPSGVALIKEVVA